jgi:phosphatidylserine synthase
MYFQSWGFVGIVIGFLPIACAGIRLARFNVDSTLDIPRKTYFVGLPTTMSACLMAAFTIMVTGLATGENVPQVAALLIIMLAFLMISTVQYEKHNILSPRYILKTRRVITGTIIVLTGILFPQIAFFAWGLLYVLYGLCYSLYVNLRLRIRIRGKHA